MSIENLIWDKQNESVSWFCNGKTIMKRYESMHFAYLKENFILIQAGKDYHIEQFYHISFEGKQIFAEFDKLNKTLAIAMHLLQ